MKYRLRGGIISAVLVLAMLFMCAAGAMAAKDKKQQLDYVYSTAYSDNGKKVALTVTVLNAVGLESGDIRIAYSEDDYEFTDTKQLCPNDVNVATGKSVAESGLVTCSFMLMDSVTEDMCDEKGNMDLVRFEFKVLKEVDPAAADADSDVAAELESSDFYLHAASAAADGELVQVEGKGNAELFKGHSEGGVPVPEGVRDKYKLVTSLDKTGIRWYVYVIIIAVVVAAVVVISIVVRRNETVAPEEKTEAADKDKEKKED